MKKIIKNAVQCNRCGEIIESTHRHDFKWCGCGNVAVDGGLSYLRRAFKEFDYTELSEYEGEDDVPDVC